jgi:predicted DNA-binding protein with PD1-like motif
MRSKLLEEREGRRAFVVVFDIGDEVAGGLAQFAREQQLGGSALTAIGALRDATLGFWDWETKDYARIPIQEQVEVVSLVGNIARGPDGSPKLHAHVVVSARDGRAYGGHLLEAHVRPTLEVIVTELPLHLQRRHDEVTGLALLEP